MDYTLQVILHEICMEMHPRNERVLF